MPGEQNHLGCTVGAVFNSKKQTIMFKNIDYPRPKRMPIRPISVKGKKFRYLKFPVFMNPHKPGLWAAVNENGVGILGADANTIAQYWGKRFGGEDVMWPAYEGAMGTAETARDAADFIVRAYQDGRTGMNGDIIFLADRREAIAVEYSLNEWGLEFSGGRPYLVRSNFFLQLRHQRPAPEEKSLHTSSALRYERALALLSRTSSNTTVEDVIALTRDHFYGENAMSICRHGGVGEYRTYGTAVFEVNPHGILVHYTVGKNPCQAKFITEEFKL
jgi:hypothetical protein